MATVTSTPRHAFTSKSKEAGGGQGGGGDRCSRATGGAQGRCIGKQRAKAEVQAGVGVPTHEGKGRHGSMDGGPPKHVQPGRGAPPEVCQVACQAG